MSSETRGIAGRFDLRFFDFTAGTMRPTFSWN
jgi:hypothetical protein